MTLGERLLRYLSVAPSGLSKDDLEIEGPRHPDPLRLLRSEVPNLTRHVKNKVIVDFGCGLGDQIDALMEEGASFVYGLDSNRNTLRLARRRLEERDADTRRYSLCLSITDVLKGRADVVISQNAMEHFPDPDATLAEMLSLLRPDGLLIISFGPPWYAPYGSHMHFFCRVPWLNLLFPEKTVMKVRSIYRDDGASRYEDVESGLNKMTVQRFEHLLDTHGLTVSYLKLRCVKDINWLASIPVVRELFVNHITCIATRAAVHAEKSEESDGLQPARKYQERE